MSSSILLRSTQRTPSLYLMPRAIFARALSTTTSSFSPSVTQYHTSYVSPSLLSVSSLLRNSCSIINSSQRTNSSFALTASVADKLLQQYYVSSRSFSSNETSKTISKYSNGPPPFRKILIANRGEIAIRIIQTARKHNIQTVAIYSTADSNSLHVKMADEAVCIGPPASNQSYLDIDKVCEAIDMTGSEAVHPGYGFLSENSHFAERVEEMFVNEEPHHDDGSSSGSSINTDKKKSVKFIGPSKHAIESLGDKIQSKLIADAAGVSTIPGYNGVVTSPEHAVQIAHEIGYPVMIKASSGGGGKGMRICYTDEQVIEGYRLGSAEAKSFFGDDRLLVEKYVEDPHHIEIQVLSGMNPNTNELDILCFVERECSIQRRNQKVIEESPSPHLLPSTRSEMIRQVKSLVREVGYESAGTVEFLVDKDQNCYFLEMNTRLQVEHPVTEMISGDGYSSGNYVDLVHGMLEVASGRGIPQKYLDMVDCTSKGGEEEEGANVRYTGHAIEARVYAEDPLRGFLPSTGPLVKYAEPPSLLNVSDTNEQSSECHVRIDTGVVPGAIITPHYDPILSKIISYSSISRNVAIEGLGSALDQYILRGVQHNVPFVRDVLRNDDFIKGYTPTSFIEEHYPEGFSGGQLSERERRELVVIAREIMKRRERVIDAPPLPLLSSKDVAEEAVVCLGGMFGDAYLVQSVKDDVGGVASSSVTKLPKRNINHDNEENDVGQRGGNDDEDNMQIVNLSELEYMPSSDLARAKIEEESRALQVSCIQQMLCVSTKLCLYILTSQQSLLLPYQVHGYDEIGMIKLTMYGSDADILVMSPAEYQLACHMKEPIPIDYGNFVMSPMPGTLISFAVNVRIRP